ncbi:Uu.00g008960.m01.CDS01 [Anthostomella pinea]|uniref:Uu.00g008960.m01.CDS01 n=1 Tax=Anthostomella pinea TaxID=933095 RepID=A0AAI8VXA6_9PEZI|nr:Uu.00g008960.m01.CDS01 [Anthostomella pinea]
MKLRGKIPLLVSGLFYLLGRCTTASPRAADLKPDHTLSLTEQEIKINCKERKSVVIEGTVPGPQITLQEGKTTWIRVKNDTPDKKVTMHWHGLSMRTAPFSDGVPMVSQWPIEPGQWFDYEIRPEAGDAGTYFYHSHVGFQANTAYGLLIVNGAEAHEYYDERAIVLADYYPQPDDEIEEGLRANPFKWPGESQAVVFNGQSGTASFDDDSDGSCKPHVIEVEPGKTYRLRFVGGTAISFVTLGIEDHKKLTIIEADGQATEKAETDHMQLGSGQRYSALLETKPERNLNGKCEYWIRYETRERPTEASGYALLRYKSDKCDDSEKKLPDESPVKLSRDRKPLTEWMEYTLTPKDGGDDFPTREEVTRTVYIEVKQHVIDGSYDGSINGGFQWSMNGLGWDEEAQEKDKSAPYLITAYNEEKTPDYDAALKNKGWDPETRAFPARVGEVLEIVWQSNSGPTGGLDLHPMHAHGQHYWDLGAGSGEYDAKKNDKKLDGYIPMRRDTTMLHRYEEKTKPNTVNGWRAWRIRVTKENVGAWPMHCHVLPHMIMRMQTVWVFGDASEVTASLHKIPQSYLQGYLEPGGSAYGKDDGKRRLKPKAIAFFD